MNAESRSETGNKEFTLPEGCLACNGDLQIRVTPGGGAQGICLGCRSFSRPEVTMTHRGLKVLFPAGGEA